MRKHKAAKSDSKSSIINSPRMLPFITMADPAIPAEAKAHPGTVTGMRTLVLH